METKTIWLLISMVIFVTYVLPVTIKFGVLQSISHSYKRITNKIWYTLFMWGIAIPLFPVVSYSGWFFFAGAGLIFSGIAVGGNADITIKVHVAGATGAIACGIAGMVFSLHEYWLAIITTALIGVLYFTKLKNHTYWIEVIAYAAIIYALLKTNIL